MWIARDKDNSLCLFRRLPKRDKVAEMWLSDFVFMYIDRSLFPELTWEDEPIKVKIIKVTDDER